MVFAPWFGMTFTLKRFTIGAVLAVMLLGFLCPFAPNLHTLYVLRALQGVAGGCLPPMLIIVALRYLPPKIKLYGLAGYALTATFGPALGTPLAALWTEYVGWQMAFWQIVPLGLVSCVAIYKGLPADPTKLERFRSFNWSGFILGYPAIAMLVIGLLQGDRLDWLNSTFISTMFYGGALLFVAFLINEWFHPLPFFKLQLLVPQELRARASDAGRRSYATGWRCRHTRPVSRTNSRLQAAANHAAVFAGRHSPIDCAACDRRRPEPPAGRPPLGHGHWTFA